MAVLVVGCIMLCFIFFFNDTATTEIYTVSDTLPLHDALPISSCNRRCPAGCRGRWSTSRRSEEHTSELQSPDTISYAVFCLKKKKKTMSNIHFQQLIMQQKIYKQKEIY